MVCPVCFGPHEASECPRTCRHCGEHHHMSQCPLRCLNCQGTGIVLVHIHGLQHTTAPVLHHTREDSLLSEVCSVCEGTGLKPVGAL